MDNIYYNSKEYKNKIIEVIRLLASSSEIQLRLFPDKVEKSDEIYFTFDEIASYVDKSNLINSSIILGIKELYRAFDNVGNSLWNDEAVTSSAEWETIRIIANNILSENDIVYKIPRLYWIKDIYIS